MRALLVCNRSESDPGFVGERLAQHDFSFTRVSREYPGEWPTLDGIDLLLHLGSEWSVYSEGNEKEVAAEVDLVTTAMQRGVPIFGICYGAQLISHALGGTVTRAQTPEVGWHEVSSTAYPDLLAGTWLQWHYDVFTVPSSLRAVAVNDVGPQAMLGKRVFATQFHPEATQDIITRWSTGTGTTELSRLGIDAKHLCEMSVDQVAARAPATTRLVDWFLGEVAA